MLSGSQQNLFCKLQLLKIFQILEAILAVLAENTTDTKAPALTGWNPLRLELNLDLP